MTAAELMRLKLDALEVIAYWFSHPPTTINEHQQCAEALFRAEAAHNAAYRELNFLERIGDFEHEFPAQLLAIQAVRDMVHDEPRHAAKLNAILRALQDHGMEGGAS